MKNNPAIESKTENRLFEELRFAVQQTSADDMKRWGMASARRFPLIGKRRIKNFAGLVKSIASFARHEGKNATQAWRENRLGTHLGDRTVDGIDTTIDVGQRIYQTLSIVTKALREDPKKNAPGVLALALGFMVGSGGLDGNGGIPDTDITMFGIGDHRSISTHSIIAGIVIEGVILALADLADIVCEKVPPGQRSPFWDSLISTKNQIAGQLALGTSAGIAYHLGVDATIQPAAYKDLPFSMPMEAHQLLFAVNSAAEGFDAATRGETTGKKVVARTSDGAAALGAGIKALFGKAS